MGKRKKKIVIKKEEIIKIRKPVAPPAFSFKDKKRYSRKVKFKKGWGDNKPGLFFYMPFIISMA